jgi:4-oxalmesaconate hydratase
MTDESFEAPIRRHLQATDERNIDIQLISNHSVHMRHWETPEVQQIWCRTVNDAIAQKVRLRPDRFVGVGQLPQNAQLDTSTCSSCVRVPPPEASIRRRLSPRGPRGRHRKIQ